MNDKGKVGVGKVRQNDLAFQMNARLEKFSENALKASSSWNRILDQVGSDEEEAPEQRGFRARVDLCLGAIDMINRKQEEREKKKEKTIRKVPSNFKYNKFIEKKVHMHGECMNM